MHTVYLGLGSNLGDRAANLRRAVKALMLKATILAESAAYETPPWGVKNQPAFLNMAVKLDTELTPMELRDSVKGIEVALGRERSYHWGPRVIDIDILFYDDLIMDEPGLVIPHPRLHERGFVLVPLESIASNFVHPLLGLSIRELLQRVDTSGIVPA
jgi:2-amino-4-hydroxy-6-hydroxymethyldihydropteridine diphosphokinase